MLEKKYGLWFETESRVIADGFIVENDFIVYDSGDYSVCACLTDKEGTLKFQISTNAPQETVDFTISAKAERNTVITIVIGEHVSKLELTDEFVEYKIENVFKLEKEVTIKCCDDTVMKIWIDRMELGSLGIIKKTLTQIKEEIGNSRWKRLDNIIRADRNTATDFNLFFDKLWLDEPDANEELIKYLSELTKKASKKENWSPLDAHLGAMNIYFCFGKKGKFKQGALSPEAEKALLEYLWVVCEPVDDIALTQIDTWFIHSSENHDIGLKIACLLSSMIFSNEPDFCDRVYTDRCLGYKGSKQSPLRCERKYAERKLALTAKEHYGAWCAFFREYFSERAKKGFFLERASQHYMKWTLGVIYGLYNFVRNESLRQTVKSFLDLVWADWAQEVLCGVRGGVKTRHHHGAGENNIDAMQRIATWLLGGETAAELSYRFPMLGNYELPDVVLKMALDRQGMGKYSYFSRGITEENPVMPRPEGTDYTMIANVESRCVRVSYVTPNYILSSQWDHPLSNFNHLAVRGRWMGLVTHDVCARIVPVALDPSRRHHVYGEEYCMDLVCSAVQHENVLILQQKRRFMQIDPNLFPAYDDLYDRDMGIFIGNGWDEKKQHGNTLFLRKGNVFASVRVILCKTDEDPLAWAKGTSIYQKPIPDEDAFCMNAHDTILRLRHKFSPVIIEAGDKAEYGSFERFCDLILKNKPELIETVVTDKSGVVIRYTGIGKKAAELLYNAANCVEIPRINGQEINYCYPMTFDSPYLKSDYNSGQIYITYDSQQLILYF